MAHPAPVPRPPAPSSPTHRVVMCCDFFSPRVGGVEQHIYCLATALRALGHEVAIVTGRYAAPPGAPPRPPRVGVRYLSHGLRVYHLPHLPMADQASAPTYFGLLPLLRAVLLRERATLAHGHAATSVLTHDFLQCARALGLPTVFTDHSLFGAADFASVNVNKYLALALREASAAVAVSRASQLNLHQRTGLPLGRICCIPNAVDGSELAPPEARSSASASASSGGRCPRTIVVLSRLVLRKGCDVLVELIPLALARWPHLRFVVGGEGPKRGALEALAARLPAGSLQLVGHVPRERVAAHLARGALFLNCSLTESFCIAILEAACAGCHVLTTAVGGVPEVLPPHMVTLAAAPTAGALLEALGGALARAAVTDPAAQHREAAALYTWPAVAQRTAALYSAVAAAPRPSLAQRFYALGGLGPLFGPLAVILAALMHLMVRALAWLAPEEDIEAALPAPRQGALARALWGGGEGSAEARAAAEASLTQHLLAVGRA
jgi:phosphatidylinositol glycan class A protein